MGAVKDRVVFGNDGFVDKLEETIWETRRKRMRAEHLSMHYTSVSKIMENTLQEK